MLAVSTTLVGVSEAVGPFVTSGETVEVSVTVPANPWRLVSVIVEDAGDPADIER